MIVRNFTCGLLAWGMVCAAQSWIQRSDAADDQVIGERGMIATVNPLATEAGLRAFRAGGNAVDAAVAAALTLGVVDGHNSGLGGGCLILVRRGDGRLLAIDGRKRPRQSDGRDVRAHGQVDPELSQTAPWPLAFQAPWPPINACWSKPENCGWPNYCGRPRTWLHKVSPLMG